MSPFEAGLPAREGRRYHCPGEKCSIDRAVHLARLNVGYPGCRQCGFQNDRGPESSLRARQIAAALARPAASAGIHEVIGGVDLDAWSPRLAAALAAAWATNLRAEARADRPRVVVAYDGRSLLRPLIEAFVSRLRWSACDVVELEPTTAPATAMAIDHLQADGGLYLGSGPGQATSEVAVLPGRLVALKLWFPGARPPAPEAVAAIDASGGALVDRPARRMGVHRRLEFAAEYLSRLREAWHGLRPLRFLVHGAPPPLRRSLLELTGQVACRMVPFDGHAARLPEEIRAQGAHFGACFADDGEIVRFVDQTGRPISAEAIFLAIASDCLHDRSQASLVVDTTAAPGTTAALDRLGARIVRVEPNRFAVSTALVAEEAVLGFGPDGRLWYPAGYADCDALRTLTAVVRLLSRSDRPVSAVFANAEDLIRGSSTTP